MTSVTTRVQIEYWLKLAKAGGATHLIVAVDTFEWDDYPVFVMPGQDVHELIRTKYSGQNMQGLMEVYKLDEPLEPQLDRERNFEF